jgi:hypothetical protein
MFGEGLSKLLDVIKQAWDMLKPYAAVYPWENGVLLRRGSFLKILEEGYYFKWPCLDKVVTVDIALTTMRGENCTIGERTVKWTAKYRVVDAEAFVIDIYEEKNYLRDCIQAHVAQYMSQGEEPNEWSNMMRRMRDEVKEGGFDVVKLRLIDDARLTFTHRQFSDAGELEE